MEYIGNVYGKLNGQFFPICHSSVIDKKDDRIAELESENGELRAQVNDLKSSDEGHVRAREIDEAQIKDLLAENKRLRECIGAFLYEATPWLDISGAMYNQDLADCADRRLRIAVGEG